MTLLLLFLLALGLAPGVICGEPPEADLDAVSVSETVVDVDAAQDLLLPCSQGVVLANRHDLVGVRVMTLAAPEHTATDHYRVTPWRCPSPLLGAPLKLPLRDTA